MLRRLDSGDYGEITHMKKLMGKIQIIVLAGMLALGLTACGGSSSPSTPAVTTASKTSSWADVSASSGDRKVTISWDRTGSTATSISTYNLYWSTDPTIPATSVTTKIVNVTSPYVLTSGLENGKTYYFAVTEVTSAGEGPKSFIVSASPMATTPTAPVGLQAVAKDGEVDLYFTGTTPANTTYSLIWSKYVGSAVSGPFEITNLSVNSTAGYQHTALLNDGAATYQYQLKAVRNGIESKLGNPITIYPQAAITQAPVPAVGLPFGNMSTVTTPGKPGRPSGLKVVAGNQQVRLDWTVASEIPSTANTYDIVKTSGTRTVVQASSGSAGISGNTTTVLAPIAYYDIYWDVQPINPNSPPANVIRVSASNSTFTHTGLNNLTTYYYAIKAIAATNNLTLPTYPSGFSSIVSAVPTPKVPDVPSAVTIVGGSQKADLSWNKDASGLTGVTYNVYALKSATSPTACKSANNLIATVTSNSYSHTGLIPGDTWYYCVTSHGEAESDASAVASYAIPKLN